MKTLCPPELINFANSFSEKYRDGNPGNYYSEDNSYVINYGTELEDNYWKLNTVSPLAVSVLDKPLIIKISKQLIESTPEFNNKDFVFSCIIWAEAINYYGENGESAADIDTFIICTLQGRDMKSITDGWLLIFSNAPSAKNIQRAATLTYQINKSKQ